MFAIILSFVFHGVLIWTFENFDLLPSTSAAPERVFTERLKIDPRLLQQQEAIRDIPKTLAPADKPDIEAFQPKLDDYEKASMIPENQEIDLSPNVKEIQNLVRATSPEQKQGTAQTAGRLADMLAAAPMEGPSQEDIASAMAAVKSTVLSKPLSSKQLVLEAAPKGKGDANIGMAILDSLGDGKGKTAASTKVPGFSSLDDLLASGGQVGGSTAPILMPTDLLFEFGSDQLAEKARLSLMKLGFLIQKNPTSLFIIEGHTDTIGSEQSNIDLSQRRANAVVGWLINSLQLGTDRVQAIGMGERYPLRGVDPDGDKDEQAMNRRVEIKVRPRQ
ncbi:MAG: OmpA family protein [Verrucomicrobiaceae bacterium]|nr:OmpA family protein [Verrucomicrobiaceae bacterium]